MPRFAAKGLAPCTVLLVDDEPSFRSVFQELLEMIGCKVLAAANGPQALQLVQQDDQPIHLVIMDYSMPAMDGVATLAELQNIRPDMKRILCSGHLESDCLKGRILEEYIYLAKPFGFQNLCAVVAQALAPVPELQMRRLSSPSLPR